MSASDTSMRIFRARAAASSTSAASAAALAERDGVQLRVHKLESLDDDARHDPPQELGEQHVAKARTKILRFAGRLQKHLMLELQDADRLLDRFGEALTPRGIARCIEHAIPLMIGAKDGG